MTNEILAPAGDEKSALAAISAGADAIYLGLTSFSARSSAENFDFEALRSLIARARLFGVKIYVAMNTLVKDGETERFVRTAVEVWNLGADAIIVQDLYLGAYLKKTYPQMVLHLSTQAGVCNEYGALLAKKLGYSRVILARETALEDVAKIAKIIETEVFVQGALCTCFSGQCYLSSFAGGNSGNRGRCKQPCRKRYAVDRDGFRDFAYRISLSDLRVGEDVDKLKKSGVFSFKIEGRMRRPEYVSAAVSYYKKLLGGGADASDLSALKRTYNRGNYTKGLSFGQDKSLISSAVQGHIGEYLGVVEVTNGKFFCRSSEPRAQGDCFKILRGGVELCGATFSGTARGGFYLDSSVRLKNGDKVFITTDASLNRRLNGRTRTRAIRLSVHIRAGERPCAVAEGKRYFADFIAEEATGRPLTCDDVKKCFDKTDAYPFEIIYESVEAEGNVFIPVSLLNAFRRKTYASLYGEMTRVDRPAVTEVFPLPAPPPARYNSKTAVLCSDLNGVRADVGVLRPTDYSADLTELSKRFDGEKFLYLPPFLSGRDLESIEPLLDAFDGIYCGGNYAVLLAEKHKIKLFAGTGFNLSNALSLALVPADYIALSKELTRKEAAPLARENTFFLTAGDIKVMDLVYCPFGKTCSRCDGKTFYTLTDEDGRAFPLRRYRVTECRFEVLNCRPLVAKNDFTGVLADLTSEASPDRAALLLRDEEELKKRFVRYTKGHSDTPVI